MANIKTKLTYYRFDISKHGSACAYQQMVDDQTKAGERLEWISHWPANPGKEQKTVREFQAKLRAIVGRETNAPDGVGEAMIEIETAHLFSDQWNTAPIPGICETGLRVMNWCEWKYPNEYIKEGYFITQSPELREAMRNTNVCGYCGKQEAAAKGYVFCPHCIDSEYLTEDMLYMTRMVPVYKKRDSMPPLTDAERAHLLPIYRKAQIEGATARGKARIAKAHADVHTSYNATIAKATIKRDAALWLLENAPFIYDDWIYYDHTGRHCFGWRSPLNSALVSSLLDVITEFPFPYDIKCADGRELSGER